MTPSVNESLVTGVRLLISQLRAVQRAHRAGITPNCGQLENLFETTDVVERHLDGVNGDAPGREICDTVNCGRPMARRTTEGQRLCVDCAAKLIAGALFGDKTPAIPLVTRNGDHRA